MMADLINTGSCSHPNPKGWTVYRRCGICDGTDRDCEDCHGSGQFAGYGYRCSDCGVEIPGTDPRVTWPAEIVRQVKITRTGALKLLKGGWIGVCSWNVWRRENPKAVQPILDGDLSEADLQGVNLSNGCLGGINLRGANLFGADLSGASLFHADLSGADLRTAKLDGANFTDASLCGANLAGTELHEAKFHDTDLSGAKLCGAGLLGTEFIDANVNATNFIGATFGRTILSRLDLGPAFDSLTSSRHAGPSTIGTDTLAISKGRIPEAFLRGCGLSDWEIEAAKLYDSSLTIERSAEIADKVHWLRHKGPAQVGPIFISYSHTDNDFVDRLGREFDEMGVRYWRDTKDATSGRIDDVLMLGIQRTRTTLVVLSEASVRSGWVQFEIGKAIEQGLVGDNYKLCPVMLDKYWIDAPQLNEMVRNQLKQYLILDFADWRRGCKFKDKFVRLSKGLRIHYKEE